MCGIAGIMTRDGSAPARGLLDAMESAIAHRGPDGVRRLVRGDTGLVHLRLAIMDLATGDQPLFAHGPGGPALVANGEIYNDPDLRAAMDDTAFSTHSDCEPAVYLYARHGVGFAERLRGMYAIAIHDPARGRLVLSRDPFGIKPLYVLATDAMLAFASEPQALLACHTRPVTIDPVRAAELLQLKFTTGAATIFPGIERVLPGETLVIERGEIVERRRIAALPAGRPRPAHDPLKELDAVLLNSVAAHLRADVPYGLFLSGGVDSASLLALMRRATGGRIQALTAGWENAGAVDESHEALRLAAIQGADCHRVAMGEAEFWTLAPRIAAAIDDPTADAAVLPTWMLGQAAAAGGLKVTLCGEGADELLGGYSRYRKQLAPWRWLSRRPRASGLFGELPSLDGWRDGLAQAEAAIDDRTPMQAAQAVDVAEWLPNDLLTKLDRCLMVHGVEGRTPFLDPLVAQFAFLLPDRRKAGMRMGKLLLREWLAGAFPEAGAWARKKGFKPPVGAWMQARGAALGRQVAAQPGVAAIMPPDRVAAAFAGAEVAPQPAWSLLFYALWHSRYAVGVSCEGDIGHVLAEAAR